MFQHPQLQQLQQLQLQQQGQVQEVLEVPGPAHLESILQGHRRKMLRRAANRKSAQLSRARKKAHVEELKGENVRLQSLVDMLDSQPELVFSVSAGGRISFVSERVLNFIKIGGEDSDEDPSHVSQLLCAESVKVLLDGIETLKQTISSALAAQLDIDVNTLFFSKEVFFLDTVGNKVSGMLRCSRIQRRISLQDLQNAESGGSLTSAVAAIVKPQTNKRKSCAPVAKRVRPAPESVNLSNFNLLAECVSNIANSEYLASTSMLQLKSNSGSNNNLESLDVQSQERSALQELSASAIDLEEEFICIIRTDDAYFAHFNTLRMFSPLVPNTPH